MANNQQVGDGQTVTGSVLNDGDVMTLYSQSVFTQGYQPGVSFGGRAFNTIVNFGGTQNVGTGYAVNTLVNAGGEQHAGAGGLVQNTVLSGGTQFVDFGATVQNTIIGNGGFQKAFGGATSGTIINDGGAQFVSLNPFPPMHYVGPWITPAVTDTVVNSGGRQILYYIGAQPTGTHLMPGGSIELAYTGATPDNLPGISFNAATDVLTVGGREIYLAGDYGNTLFTVSAIVGTDYPGTLITAQAICFCRGTRIATPTGQRAVEDIRIGDQVLTGSGRIRPVRWIGSGSSLVAEANRPVLIRAGAIAAGVPDRDLFVTRGHSFLFGDVLIPIGELVNGDSILWDEAARTMTVYHLELDAHDILLAEGARAESYRDDGNRAGFRSGGGEHGVARGMPTCAPVVTRGPIVERTRRVLAERAARMDGTRAGTRAGAGRMASSA